MDHKYTLLINHRSPATNSGKASGISNYLFNLTRHLVARDNLRVGVVSSWNKKDFPADIVQRLAFYRTEKMLWPRLLDTFWQSATMPRIAASFGADAILNIDPIGSPLGAKVRFFVVHDLYFKTLPNCYRLRERLLSHWILKLMLRGNQCVIAVSENTAKSLRDHYPSSVDRTFRIYSGAPPRTNGKPDLVTAGDHILWVSNVTANKNIDCFYRAIELLSQRGQALKAVVVGSDPDGLEKEARSILKNASHPDRYTNVSESILDDLYHRACCLVNTSFSEGFGLPVLEAQSMGVPVICPDESTASEIGGKDSVITFQPNSAEDLAEKITAVNESESLRKRFSESGYLNSQRFSWDSTAAEVESLLIEHLKSGNESSTNSLASAATAE